MGEAGSDDTISGDRVDRAIVGALRGQDLSGFEIWRWLGSGEGGIGQLTEEHLYPTLYSLEAEGLLESEWHEGERTRRKYRLTSRAMQRASERGWPPIAFHGAPNVLVGTSLAERRPVSPDPEVGSWFVPPKPETPARAAPTPTPTPAARASAESHAAHEAPNEAPNEAHAAHEAHEAPNEAQSAADRPGRAAIEAYANDLGAHLDLPPTELNRVRQEIADHLKDSASALELQLGHDSEAAATEAMGRLGPPDRQASLIVQAQQTRDRQKRGISRGVIELAAEVILWLTLSVVALVLTPGAVDIVISLGNLVGLHLVVLRSAEWATNQTAVMLCVGAFAAGRMSLGRAARISRHSFGSIRKPWALGGAAAVLALGLVLPGYPDALTVVTTLLVPVAFVAGTFRPQLVNEGAYSPRAVGAVVLLVAVVTFLPFGRMFAYDPNATPDAPIAHGEATVELKAFAAGRDVFYYELPESGGSGIVTVELWPASTDGLFIVVDRSATAPSIIVSPGIPSSDSTVAPTGAQAVDFTKLPPYHQWWVVAVSTGPDGHRTALDVLIQTGASPSPDTALGWLISHF